MNLIILGPQGAGKGTQAKLLAQKYQLPHLSVGKLFRSEMRNKTKYGKKVANFVNAGKLVPLSIVEDLLKKELTKSKYKKGIILDGFPRDLTQVNFLRKLIEIDYLILITLSQKDSIKRLGCRRVCVCGELYNICLKKPKVDTLCDVCGKKLFRREDDYPQAIKKRLAIYKTETRPVIDYYKKQKKMIKVNGNQSILKVHKDIVKLLKDKI